MIDEQIIKYETDFGDVQLCLKTLMNKKKMSIYYLSKATGIKYDIVRKYYYNENCAYNRDVLAKFCFALHCKISDLLIYISKEEKK